MRATKKDIMQATTFEELLDIEYGEIGTPERDEFEARARDFVAGELQKEAHKTVDTAREELLEAVV